MKRALSVLCLLAIVSLSVAHHNQTASVQQLTEEFMSAMERHDTNAAERMMDGNVLIDYHTEAPIGGLYKGHKGFRMMHEIGHALLTDNCECKFRIKFIHESSGCAALDATCSITFKRTGKSVTAKKCFFLHWEMGKLAYAGITDENYAEIMDAYRTTAEKDWYTLAEKLALTGTDGGALDMVSDDATFEFGAVYPRELLNILGLTNLRGKAGFTTLNKKMSTLIRNPLAVEVVYANDTHVMVATMLGNPRLMRMAKWSAPAGRVARDSRITVLVNEMEFRDGKLMCSKMCMNRPMLPMQLFNLQRMLAGKKMHTSECDHDCGAEEAEWME